MYKDELLLIQHISVFLDTFNRKPGTELFYSEVLLTQNQIKNYEKAIREIRKKIGHFDDNLPTREVQTVDW